MRNKLFLLCLGFFLFILVLPGLMILRSQGPLVVGQDKVVYTLPYPGLLPDHPLYFAKVVRDRILEFTTRDTIKKAELYLLLSDKRLAMAMDLSVKGKDKLAVTTFSKAEKYFEKIQDLLITSKKQGVSPSADFINRLKMSNIKHRQIGEMFLKELPQGQADTIESSLELNGRIKKRLAQF